MNKYKAVKGSILTDEQAITYGKHIEGLSEANNGNLTAQIILDDARNESSPLHDFFDWDIYKAAEKHWISESYYLLRSINVVIIQENKEIEVRAFHPVIITKEVGRTYVNIDRVFSEEDLRKQVIENALRELAAWRKKYAIYTELSHIFEAIEQAEKVIV